MRVCSRVSPQTERDSILTEEMEMVGDGLTTAAREVGSKCSQSAANRMETALRKNSVNPVSCWKVPISVQTWDVARYSTPDATGFLGCFLGSSQQDLLGLFLRQEFEGEVSY